MTRRFLALVRLEYEDLDVSYPKPRLEESLESDGSNPSTECDGSNPSTQGAG